MIKCELCNRTFMNLGSLSKHLKFIHKENKLFYYHKYLAKSTLDGYCAVCGRPVKFLGLHGYKSHCSNVCAQKDPKILAKIHTPEHEKHVSEGVIKSYNKEKQLIQADKRKQTCLEKYGVDNPAKNENVKNKFRQTLSNKKIQFCIDNNCTPRQELINRYGQSWLRLNISTIKCGNVLFIKNEYIPIIEQSFSKSSIYEKIIYNFIDKIYDGPILKHHRPYWLFGQELDLYLPELNLAIEYNGSYYHCIGTNVGVQDPYYHYNKSKNCFLAGVRLIHIYEFESLFTELMLLKSLIYYGIDRYDLTNPNKYWEFDSHLPYIIGYYQDFPIYSA